MDVLDYCRAMASYCRQRTQFDGEDSAFWTEEATQWEGLLREHEPARIAPDRSETSRSSQLSALSDGDVTPRYRCPKPESKRSICLGVCEIVLG